MKKRLYFALVTLSTLSLLADTLKDGDSFTVNGAPTNLTAAVAVGEDIEFDLEENGTTGFLWEAVDYDSTKLKVEIDHKGPGNKQLSGAPGKVEVELEPLVAGEHKATLRYRRSWEHADQAARVVSVVVSSTANQQESPMGTTCRFLKDCGHYFIATVDQDQPRVRPFGTVNIFEGKLYIQTGRKKNVAKQILANPKVEICAFNGKEWIRVETTLKQDPRREAKKAMLDAYPSLRSMYSEDDDNTLVLYMNDTTATISSFDGAPKVMRF